jgi:CRP/FNR family transcriptional regulator, cyclic AMP receptor protein
MQESRVSTTLLRNVPVLASLTDAQCESVAHVARLRMYKKGDFIANAGDEARALFVVVSGSAQAVMSDREGNHVILAILKPGSYFGEIELLDEQPFAASLVAREHCDVMTLGKRQFSRCLEENFEMAMAVLRGMARRVRDADSRFGSLAWRGVDARLAQFLLSEAEWVDGARIVTSRYTKRDIGRVIGASRECVSRVMKDLQTRGYIEAKGDAIVLRERILSLT